MGVLCMDPRIRVQREDLIVMEISFRGSGKLREKWHSFCHCYHICLSPGGTPLSVKNDKYILTWLASISGCDKNDASSVILIIISFTSGRGSYPCEMCILTKSASISDGRAEFSRVGLGIAVGRSLILTYYRIEWSPWSVEVVTTRQAVLLSPCVRVFSLSLSLPLCLSLPLSLPLSLSLPVFPLC